MATPDKLSTERIKTLFEGAGIKLNERSASMIKEISEDMDFGGPEGESAEGGVDAEMATDLSDELHDMIDELTDIADDLAAPEEREEGEEEGEEEHHEEEHEEKPEDNFSEEPGEDEEESGEPGKFGESRKQKIAEQLLNKTYQIPGAKSVSEMIKDERAKTAKPKAAKPDELDKLLGNA